MKEFGRPLSEERRIQKTGAGKPAITITGRALSDDGFKVGQMICLKKIARGMFEIKSKGE